MKKGLYTCLLACLSFLILLLSACGSLPSDRNGATPTPTGQAVILTPGQSDQYLVYRYKDAANAWHLQRYNTRTGQKIDI